MKKRRIAIIIGAVVALAAGGVYLATRSTGSGQTGINQVLANLPTVAVVRTTLANSVDSTGSIAPVTKMQLPFGAAGTVQTVEVAVGDRVKQGDVLATLDPTDLQLKLTQVEQAYLIQQITYSNTLQADPRDVALAQASVDNAGAAYRAAQQDFDNQTLKQTTQCSQLTSAKAGLDRAQTAYDRVANDHQAKQYLVPGGRFYDLVTSLDDARSAYDQAVSNCNVAKLNLNDSALRSAQAQLQTARNNLDSLISPRAEKQIQAAAKLEQARLSLVQAQRNLADATLVAPVGGVITAVNARVGAAAGSGAAIELADLSQLHVDVLVDETQIENVKAGQKVELTLDAMSGITLTGQVERIDPTGTVSQGVVNYSVRVKIEPTDTAPRLDMTANAAILGETHENVLAVPTTAIRTGGFGAFAGQGRQNATGGQGATGGRVVTDTQAAGGQARQRVQGSFVLVIENGQPRPVQVTEGLTSGDLVEVTGDLKEGDLVVVGELTLPTGARPNGAFFGGPPGGGLPGGGAGGPPPF